MANALKALSSFGRTDPTVVTAGPVTITERLDLAVASVAGRKGRTADLAARAVSIGLPLPGPATFTAGAPFSSFWVTPDMWFVEAPFATHEQIADLLKTGLEDAASVTEQSDAWVILDLASPDLGALFERLCNVDFAVAASGHVTRTVIDHLGIYLVKHGSEAARLYGPRSSADSLLHALETAAKSAF